MDLNPKTLATRVHALALEAREKALAADPNAPKGLLMYYRAAIAEIEEDLLPATPKRSLRFRL